MDTLNNIVIDKIVRDCISLYNSLPKSGKPSECEWTVLSCVIMYSKSTEKFNIVSLGTGSKCIGASKMSPLGSILNDSHAEVFARRGFLFYLYENIFNAHRNKESIFEIRNGTGCLKNDFVFIFYSSKLPCGDASIIPKSDEECFGDVLASKKHKLDDIHDKEANNPKTEGDIHRTGAKCLPNQKQDPKCAGKEYHVVGQVRTKPGRGERTLSVSCSDKIARWIHVGIQGALLDILLAEPIFISHFIFGGGVPYSKDTLERAFFYRTNVDKFDCLKKRPSLYQSSVKFQHLKSNERSKAASGSIIWINTSSRLLEVSIQGKKLGVTRKKENCPSSFLSICKYTLYKKFQEILNESHDLKSSIVQNKKIQDLKYNEMKIKSQRYLDSWKLTKEKILKTWTRKPDMWNFTIKE